MRTSTVTIVAAAQACQDWRMTRALRSAILVAGVALGVFSLAVARGGAGYSFGGSSAFAGAAEPVAGYALLAVGVTAWMRPRQAGFGEILVVASFAWFLLEWSNTAAGSVVFTTGLVLYAAARRWSLTRCSHTQTAGLAGGGARLLLLWLLGAPTWALSLRTSRAACTADSSAPTGSTAGSGSVRRPRCASCRWPSFGPGCGPGAPAPRSLGW